MKMINISVSEFMILCSSVLLICKPISRFHDQFPIRPLTKFKFKFVQVLLLTEVLDWTQLFPWAEECNFPRYTFGYADRNGPHMWKLLYPDSNGSNQSPINVATRLAVVVQPSEPLRWTGYDKGPLSMTITNNENNGAIFPPTVQ